VDRTIGYVDAAGRERTVYEGDEISVPSGVALSGDQAMLVVADAQARFSWSFQLNGDGTVANGEPFFRLEVPEAGWKSGVQGVTQDSIGQVYFATPLGVQMCEANGRMGEILNAPEHGAVASVAFGGEKMDWMFVAEGGRVFRRPVKVTGVGAWSVVKLPKPPL
jgi:sugar lactone lactonase YvrE